MATFYVDNKQKIYYSTFGDPIDLETKQFLLNIDSRDILPSDFQTQEFEDTSCGLYCILILYLLNKGHKFENIILSLVKE